MKTIIAGSRNVWLPKEAIQQIVTDSGFNITELVCGMAEGVDRSGLRWANANRIQCKEFPAHWNTHGKAAGPIRNKQMAEYADALILIWDGSSPGSRNMLRQANQYGLDVYQVRADTLKAFEEPAA